MGDNGSDLKKKEQWELVEGIRWNSARVITSSDGEPMLSIGLAATPAIERSHHGEIYAVLAQYFDDGSVKALQLRFDRLLDYDCASLPSKSR
jgi:hypothetical protein